MPVKITQMQRNRNIYQWHDYCPIKMKVVIQTDKLKDNFCLTGSMWGRDFLGIFFRKIRILSHAYENVRWPQVGTICGSLPPESPS